MCCKLLRRALIPNLFAYAHMTAQAISEPKSPLFIPPSASENPSERAEQTPSATPEEDSSDDTPTDPGTSTAAADPDGDTDASASNTTDVHPL